MDAVLLIFFYKYIFDMKAEKRNYENVHGPRSTVENHSSPGDGSFSMHLFSKF